MELILQRTLPIHIVATGQTRIKIKIISTLMVVALLLITNKMGDLQITNKMGDLLNKNSSQIIMVMEITTIINSTSNKMETVIIINMVETMEPHSLDRKDLLYRCPIILTRTNSFLQMTSICDL